jgi:MoxR-like ATPase
MTQENTVWSLLEKVIPHTPRLLLFGIPGTGKSYQASNLSVKKEQQVYTTTLTHDSTAAELMGHYVPTDTGSFEWIDGLGIRAWREGARLVINEIDHAGADVMTFLHALLDDPQFAKFTLPNKDKETVRPADGFQAIATMNGVPTDLGDALRDRFPVTMKVDTVHPDALNVLPKNIRAVYNDFEHDAFSIRRWSAFANLMNSGLSKEDSVRAVFPNESSMILEALALQDHDNE